MLAFIMPVETYAQRNKTKISHRDNGRSKIHYTNNGKDFKIEYEGDITLSDDDSEIIGISDGGYIEIERSSFGSRRRVLIEANRNGNLSYKYFVGRSEKNYNPEGKEWLADILLDVVRSSTIAAESRVQRFYAKGGASAVLDEIGKIDSDYVQSRYFSLLLDYDLNDSELVSVIDLAGRSVKSDHYLSTILKSNQKAFLSSERTVDAYINASKSLNSDHYMTSVLKQVINDRSITDDQMARLLDMSKSINSDHYLTTVLTQIMDSRNLNDKNVSKIINLSKDINSDHYKTVVLKKVISEKDIPQGAYDALMTTLDDVQSDHYTTEIMKQLLDRSLSASTSNLSSLLEIVRDNVQSDHYSMVIYKKLANHNLTNDQLIAALNATSNISSDNYLSQVLLAFAPQVKNSSERAKSA